MALTLTNIGAANDTTSSANGVLTTTGSVAVGDAIVVMIGSTSNNSFSSVTDSAGNTYVSIASVPGASGAAAQAMWWCAAATHALPAGSTITATLATSTTVHVLGAFKLSGGAAIVRDSGTFDAGSPSAAHVTLTTKAGDVAIGAIVNGASSSTVGTPSGWSSDWNAQVGGSSRGTGIAHVTATGNSTNYNPPASSGGSIRGVAASFYTLGKTPTFTRRTLRFFRKAA